MPKFSLKMLSLAIVLNLAAGFAIASLLKQAQASSPTPVASGAIASPSPEVAKKHLQWQFEFDDSVPKEDRAIVEAAGAKVSALIESDKVIAIVVRTGGVPGKWIAAAKPDQESLDPKGLPTKGSMILNLAYSTKLEPVEHELLHVLGIGTLWGKDIDPIAHLYKADTLAGKTYGGAIPLDKENAHWDETALGAELMTPYDEGEKDMPLGDVSIAALEDLGWKIDPQAKR